MALMYGLEDVREIVGLLRQAQDILVKAQKLNSENEESHADLCETVREVGYPIGDGPYL